MPCYSVTPPIWYSRLVKTNIKNLLQTLFAAEQLTTPAMNASFMCDY